MCFYHFLSAKCQFVQLAAFQISLRRNRFVLLTEFVITVAHLNVTS